MTLFESEGSTTAALAGPIPAARPARVPDLIKDDAQALNVAKRLAA